MILLIFRLLLLGMDILFGIFSGRSFNDIRNNILSTVRIYRALLPVMVYLDLLIVWLLHSYYPGLLSAFVGWLNLYSGLGVVPTQEKREDESKLFRELLAKQKLLLNGLIPQAGGRGLMKWFLRVHRLISAKAPSKSVVKVSKSFAYSCYLIHRRSGPEFLMKYLKGCSVLLQQYVGRYRIPDPRLVGPAISRTRAGLPRIIPRQQRELIRKGDPETIRFWLSLLNIYRVLHAKYRSDPFKTIEHGSGIPMNIEFMLTLRTFLPIFFRWLSVFFKLKENLLFDFISFGPFMSTKASAVISFKDAVIASSFRSIFLSCYGWMHLGVGKWLRGSMISPADSEQNARLARSFAFWIRSISPWCVPLLKGQASEAEDFYERKSKAWGMVEQWGVIRPLRRLLGKLPIVGRLAETSFFQPSFWSLRSHLYKGIPLGKLSLLYEAAGKIRCIAIMDPLTQWALRPLHKMLFKILSTIPQDGTFDQEAPIHLLRAKLLTRKDKFAASYDLSAATDCLPVLFQVEVLAFIIGRPFADAWRSILVDREYVVGRWRVPYRYGVGQPMGALSSWASLAISHHFIVQWAAYLSGRRVGWFTDYAVLGDDVVICDRKVADHYLFIMKEFGVKIGLSKSIVSPRGVMEFAKKFYSPRSVMTPIPMRELLVSEVSFPVLMNLIRKYPIRVADLLSLMGYRHRVLGGYHKRFALLPKKVKTALITYMGPGSPGFVSLYDWISSTSFVKQTKRVLDLNRANATLLESLSTIKTKSSLLCKQPGFSLTYSKPEGFDMLRLEPALAANAAWTLNDLVHWREENAPLYNAVKQNVLDPLSIEEALKSHAVWERAVSLEKLIMRRFFFIEFPEFLEMFSEVEALYDELHHLSYIESQQAPPDDLRPKARRLLKLHNRLSQFMK